MPLIAALCYSLRPTLFCRMGETAHLSVRNMARGPDSLPASVSVFLAWAVEQCLTLDGYIPASAQETLLVLFLGEHQANQPHPAKQSPASTPLCHQQLTQCRLTCREPSHMPPQQRGRLVMWGMARTGVMTALHLQKPPLQPVKGRSINAQLLESTRLQRQLSQQPGPTGRKRIRGLEDLQASWLRPLGATMCFGCSSLASPRPVAFPCAATPAAPLAIAANVCPLFLWQFAGPSWGSFVGVPYAAHAWRAVGARGASVPEGRGAPVPHANHARHDRVVGRWGRRVLPCESARNASGLSGHVRCLPCVAVCWPVV